MRGVVLILATSLVLMLSLFACDSIEESVKDSVSDEADTSFEKEKKLELEPIFVDMSGGGDDDADDDTDDDADDDTEEVTAKATAPDGVPCERATINKLLEEADVDLDEVTIDEVRLQSLEIRYKNADWNGDLDTIFCYALLFGEAFPNQVDVTEIIVTRGSGEWADISMEDSTREFIEYYLSHRNEEFTYCVRDDDLITNLVIEFQFKIGVKVIGEVNI